MILKCRVLLDDSVGAGNGKLIQIARIDSLREGAVLSVASIHHATILEYHRHPAARRVVFLAAILVACSRRVGGWAPGRARGPSAGKEQSTARSNDLTASAAIAA
jgi:hypothetical protein